MTLAYTVGQPPAYRINSITEIIQLTAVVFSFNLSTVLTMLHLVFFLSFFQGLIGWSYYMIMLPFRLTYYTLLDIFR